MLLASNRGPLSYVEGPDGALTANRGSGGLVSAMSAALIGSDAHWVCAALTDDDRRATRSAPAATGLVAPGVQMLDLDPASVLFVGDDLRDIDSGRDAGTRTAAVTFGYIHPDDNPRNWGADVVVDHPLELRKVLDNALCSC